MRKKLNKAALGLLSVLTICYISSCNKLSNAVPGKTTLSRMVTDLDQDTTTAYYSVFISADQRCNPSDSSFNTVALASFQDSATNQLVAMDGLSINDMPLAANGDNTYQMVYQSQINNTDSSAARSAVSSGAFPQAGSNVKISITGSSAADTVTQFVYMPQNMLANTADFPAGSINVQNDLPLHWIADPGNPSGSIIIKIWYVAGLSRALSNDPTLPTQDYTLTYTVPDNGSYTVSHTDLQAFHANAYITIFLGRGSLATATLPVSNKDISYLAASSLTTPLLYVTCAANWQNTTTPVRCQKSGSQNTGYQEREQQDISPCSSTYNQLRWVTIGHNTTACPVPVACTSSNCTGPNHKCINGVCQLGTLVVISQNVNHGTCFMNWGFHFPDGSNQFAYTTSHPAPCDPIN